MWYPEHGSLTRGERELIASYVSTLNGCAFCAGSHGTRDSYLTRA
jgi:AhpD family alkylhydroperoxidase